MLSSAAPSNMEVSVASASDFVLLKHIAHEWGTASSHDVERFRAALHLPPGGRIAVYPDMTCAKPFTVFKEDFVRMKDPQKAYAARYATAAGIVYCSCGVALSTADGELLSVFSCFYHDHNMAHDVCEECYAALPSKERALQNVSDAFVMRIHTLPEGGGCAAPMQVVTLRCAADADGRRGTDARPCASHGGIE